jgi:hypothetical protein
LVRGLIANAPHQSPVESIKSKTSFRMTQVLNSSRKRSKRSAEGLRLETIMLLQCLQEGASGVKSKEMTLKSFHPSSKVLKTQNWIRHSKELLNLKNRLRRRLTKS